VGLGNVTNESKATMFASPTFTGTVTLGAVGDVRITGGSLGQVLTTNGAGVLSWTTASGGGVSNLSELGDVRNIANAVNGDVLTYDSAVSKWVPAAPAGGGGGTGLGTRTTFSGTTITILDQSNATVNISNAYKGYAIYKIQTNAAAWVRIYSDDTARSIDSGRNIDTDPINVFGLVAEVVTTSADTVKMTPGVIGFNDDSPVSNTVYLNVTNLSGTTRTITVTLTLVQLEA
jgi:hypothetical protein